MAAALCSLTVGQCRASTAYSRSSDSALSTPLDLTGQPLDRLAAMLGRAVRIGEQLSRAGPAEQARFVHETVGRIDVQSDRLRLALRARRVRARLGHGGDHGQPDDEATIPLDLPVRFQSRGVETKLVMAGEAAPASNPEPMLIAAVARAHRWFEELRTGAAASVLDLAKRYGVDRAGVSRILPLACLAPDLVTAILDGRQPVDLTLARLTRIGDLPASWAEQRRLLGLA